MILTRDEILFIVSKLTKLEYVESEADIVGTILSKCTMEYVNISKTEGE